MNKYYLYEIRIHHVHSTHHSQNLHLTRILPVHIKYDLRTWLLPWLAISSYNLVRIYLKSLLFLSLVTKRQRVRKFLIKPESTF